MNHSEIQLRLYRAILMAGIVLSVVSILGNFILAFPLRLNLKWAVLMVLCVVAYRFSGNQKQLNRTMFAVFLFIICIFLPFAFVDSGGSKNNAIGYVFLLVIAISYLFRTWRRVFLVSTLIVVFLALHALEYFHPEYIADYSDWKQFVDRMIQIPIHLLVAFFILLRFAREYERINDQLQTCANVDELTGLYNRRMFNRAMEEAVKDRRQSIQLALLDMDNFKHINDKYGHCMGDEVLKVLSSLLQEHLGMDRHIVSRWGGDEFAVIYYGEKDVLLQKLEELREAFQARVSDIQEPTDISISVVSFRDYHQVAQVLMAADHQLYDIKQSKAC